MCKDRREFQEPVEPKVVLKDLAQRFVALTDLLLGDRERSDEVRQNVDGLMSSMFDVLSRLQEVEDRLGIVVERDERLPCDDLIDLDDPDAWVV